MDEDIKENVDIEKLGLDVLSSPTGRGRRSAFVASIGQLQEPKMHRRLSAYKYFMRECLDELRDRYPGGSIVLPAVSSLCAQVWSRLDPRIKQRFKDAMEASQPSDVPITTIKDEPGTVPTFTSVEYLPATPPPPRPKTVIRKAEAKKSPVLQEKKERKKKKKTGKKTIPGGPKRPLSAFVYFCKYNRPLVKKEKPHLTICDISKELGHTWNGMTEQLKWQYVQISIQDRDRYSREMAAFKSAAAAVAATEEEKVDHGYQSAIPERNVGHRPYDFQIPASNYYRVKEEPVDMMYDDDV